MKVQWFPGHMAKSMRMMEESVKLCDGIIYVLDARAPYACINNNLYNIIGNKPVIYALNKADLIKRETAERIVCELKNEDKTAVALNGTEKRGTDELYSRVCQSLGAIKEKNLKKGINKILRVMVVGVPNTGKSTIINTLCGEKRAITGDKAGITRGKQWIRLRDIDLLDTPGTMPPKFDNQAYAAHLAYIGSINDDILDIEEMCLEFLGEILNEYSSEITAKYSVVTEGLAPLEVFESILAKRGYLLKGGAVDYGRGARAIIDDFRKGRIGRICLESKRCDG